MTPRTPAEPGPSVFRRIVGPPRDVHDPKVFHHLSLVAFLAWVGLGSDGLSSSAYGPEEAFRALHARGDYTFLAVFLALATAVTVFVISNAYRRVIEHFPTGGGGYVVATKLLGDGAGVVSGSALLIDYVLTITVSVASGGDALFSMLPITWQPAKLPVEALAMVVLVGLNLRGVKESVTALLPVFLVFVATHLVLVLGGIISHLGRVHEVATEVHDGTLRGLTSLGFAGLAALFLGAYSRGGGTYTGIEAVSNGLQIMREPRVQTGKRTMLYMSVSLAFTAGGILLCYLLFAVRPEEGKTLNAVLVEAFAGSWTVLGLPVGRAFVWLTLASEGALLLVAAQTGFIDGPRVIANMAVDSWMLRRFSSLSDRLTAKDGVLLMGGAAVALLLAMRGSVSALVVMYAINVFLTFSLTTLAMLLHAIRRRGEHAHWIRDAVSQGAALVLCAFILTATIAEKLTEGAWLTLALTAALVGLCVSIRAHYRSIARKLRQLDEELMSLQVSDRHGGEPDPEKPTAVVLVGSYGALGIHSLFTIKRQFLDLFQNVVFVSVGVVDSSAFKGAEEVARLHASVDEGLASYVALARRMGFNAAAQSDTATDPVEAITHLCLLIAERYPRAVFFAGKLLWKRESWYQRLLHNETALQVERRLQWKGLAMAVLPLRITEGEVVSRPIVYS
jgi:amino acid transporter